MTTIYLGFSAADTPYFGGISSTLKVTAHPIKEQAESCDFVIKIDTKDVDKEQKEMITIAYPNSNKKMAKWLEEHSEWNNIVRKWLGLSVWLQNT